MIDSMCKGIPNVNNEKNRTEIFDILKEVMEKDKEVLFAYLYGSYAQDSIHFESDSDKNLCPSCLSTFSLESEGE